MTKKRLTIKSNGKKINLIDLDGNEIDLNGGSISLGINEYDECIATIVMPMGGGLIGLACEAYENASKKQQPE